MQNKQIGELIPIECKNGQQAVNARHLHQWLEVKKDFSNWIKAQFKRRAWHLLKDGKEAVAI
jgi:hypothetical protein